MRPTQTPAEQAMRALCQKNSSGTQAILDGLFTTGHPKTGTTAIIDVRSTPTDRYSDLTALTSTPPKPFTGKPNSSGKWPTTQTTRQFISRPSRLIASLSQITREVHS